MGIFRYIKNQIRHDSNVKTQLQNLNASFLEFSAHIHYSNISQKVERVREKTLNCKEIGISTEHYCEEEIIVSLTSFGSRIHNVHLPIETIMQGTMKPNRIILWLSEDEFAGSILPRTLQIQQKRGLEIAFCKDLKSYNKLIHSLKQYPEASIITIDDDVLYEYDIVERLVNAHVSDNKAICACRMHRIELDKENRPLPYMKWHLCINDDKDSVLNFPTGVGGVLYPPHCFGEKVFDSDAFMKLCPKADDIWFYVMARLNNTTNKYVPTGYPTGYYQSLFIDPSALSLYNTCSSTNGNDVQFNNVIKEFRIIFSQSGLSWN